MDLWEHQIFPLLDIASLCAVRELDARLFPLASNKLLTQCYLPPEWTKTAEQRLLNIVRSRYRENNSNLRLHIQQMLRTLVANGAVTLVAWLADRGWPLACLVWTHDAPPSYWVYERQVFEALVVRSKRDWVRRHFEQMMRECYWAHIYRASSQILGYQIGYIHYPLMVKAQGKQPPLEYRARWFARYKDATFGHIREISKI